MNKSKIDEFIKKCRESNLSVTPQRLAIFKQIMDDHTHPSPEMVYKRVKEEFPTISFATVYKTLETFEKIGVLAVVTPIHNTVRYDSVTEPHHHLVCIKCKKVMDVFDENLNQLDIPADILQSNKLLTYSVHFNVICSDCLQKGE
ncbi:Fur family transcriptional regulator [Calditrichota bacterium LG25]